MDGASHLPKGLSRYQTSGAEEKNTVVKRVKKTQAQRELENRVRQMLQNKGEIQKRLSNLDALPKTPIIDTQCQRARKLLKFGPIRNPVALVDHYTDLTRVGIGRLTGENADDSEMDEEWIAKLSETFRICLRDLINMNGTLAGLTDDVHKRHRRTLYSRSNGFESTKKLLKKASSSHGVIKAS